MEIFSLIPFSLGVLYCAIIDNLNVITSNEKL